MSNRTRRQRIGILGCTPHRWSPDQRRLESTVTTTGHSGQAGEGEHTLFLSLSRYVSGVIRFLSRFVGPVTVVSRLWYGYYRNEGDTTRYTVQVVNQRHHRTIVFCDHGTWLVSLRVSDYVSIVTQS